MGPREVLVILAVAAMFVAVRWYHEAIEEALRSIWRGGGGGGEPIGPAGAADPFVSWPGRPKARSREIADYFPGP